MGTNPPQGEADALVLGDWNAICFRCGSKFKASKMVKNWQGYWTCQRCWEPRQPQDFATGIQEVQTPPWQQPPSADRFTQFCTQLSKSGIPGYAGSGCMIPATGTASAYIIANPVTGTGPTTKI